ncbi:MAG: HPr family phosphocarrier protein [Myxococcota bacterium]
MSRVERDCRIENELGLHLRAAAAFVKVAESFESEVTLSRDGQCANGKSIIALVTLAAAQGTTVQVCADGPDASDAVSTLCELVRGRFGEPT